MSKPETPTRICPVCGSSRTHVYQGLGLCFACEAEFEAQGPDPVPFTPEGPTDHPRKLFLSCSPSEGEMGRKIREALEKRGHTVWTAPEKPEPGTDRRQLLEEALTDTQGIVACLSQHSVREPGDCLEDLAFAVGTHGVPLQTILLEPERAVTPPPSLTAAQWLDMSAWKDREEEGNEAFRTWFQERMDQLIEALENPERPVLGGEIAEVKKRLAVSCSLRLSEGKERDMLRHGYTGRAWLDSAISAWVDDPKGPGVCLLRGEPGAGKSAFAARFLHTNPRAAGGFFCEPDNPAVYSPVQFARTLSYLLACRVPEYRGALLLAMDEEGDLLDQAQEDPVEALFGVPFHTYMGLGPKRTLCLVVDGLEDSPEDFQEDIGDTLRELSEMLPPWLRLLVTVTEDSPLEEFFPVAIQVEIPREGKTSRADLEAYFDAALGERFGKDPAWPAARKALVEDGGGNFLTATLAAEGLLSGALDLQDTVSFPRTVEEAWYSWFAWIFPDREKYDEVWRPAFEMMLACLDPVPQAELGRVLGWDEARQADFLRRTRALLRLETDDLGQEILMFRHTALELWLEDDPDSEFCEVDGGKGHYRMAMAFLKLADPTADSLTPYEALHLKEALQGGGAETKSLAPDLRTDLLLRITHWGDECVRRGCPDSAEPYRKLASRMTETMIRERGTPEDRRLRAMALEREATLANSLGGLGKAQRCLQEAKDIREKLLKPMSRRSTPKQRRGAPKDRLALSICCERLANIIVDDQPEKDTYRRAMNLREDLVREAREPDNRLALYLSISCRKYGESLMPDLSGLDFLRKAADLARQVVDRDPAPAHLGQLAICVSHFVFKLQFHAPNRIAEGLELYRKHQDVLENLLPEDTSPVVRSNASVMYLRFAMRLRNGGRPAEALKFARKAVALGEEQVRRNPVPSCLSLLATSLQEEGESRNLRGETEAALACFRRSAFLQDAILRIQPTSAHRFSISRVWDSIAKIMLLRGEFEDALAIARNIVALREQLAKEDPSSDNRNALCGGWDTCGDILAFQGRAEEAEAFYRKGIALAEELIKTDPIPWIRGSLSARYLGLGNLLNGQGKSEQALEAWRKASDISGALVKERDDPQHLETLVDVQQKQAETLDHLDREKEAMEICNEAMRNAMLLVKKEDTAEHRRTLSRVGNLTALTLWSLGRYQQALKISKGAVKTDELLLKEDPSREHRQNYASSCLVTAGFLARLDRDAEAIPFFRKAKTYADQLVRERPTVTAMRLSATTSMFLGQLLADDKPDEALKMYRDEMKVREQLVKEDPSPDNKVSLAQSYESAGDLLDGRDGLRESLRLYKKAEPLWAEAVKEDPTVANRKNQSSNAAWIGDRLMRQDRMDEATAYIEKSVALLRQVVRDDPDPENRTDLSAACCSLGMILGLRGQRKRGMQLMKESEKILLALEREYPELDCGGALENIRSIRRHLQG